MQSFQRIYAVVKTIPPGKVVSYGQVARAAGLLPSAARVVGWALKALPPSTDVPWQRVVNRAGILSIVNPRLDSLEQRRLLVIEGVVVEETEGFFQVAQEYFHRFTSP